MFETSVLLPKIGYLAHSSGPFELLGEFAEKGNPQIIHHISHGSEPSRIAAYIINHKVCYPQRFFAWQSLIAPLLAGATHYGILWLVTNAIWSGDQITSVLIFLIGILPSFPLYMFFYGFFGGWDKATLDELNESVALTGAVRWLAHWGIYAPTALGAKISPLHGRFPISIRDGAMREAEELTMEKVKL